MTPYERAMRIYEQEPCARTFAQDLEHHLRGGYVYSSPTSFIMGRPVCKDAPVELIVDPAIRFPGPRWGSAPDCWLIYLAAGPIVDFFRHEPYSLPFVGWEIRNKFRFYQMSVIKERILKL